MRTLLDRLLGRNKENPIPSVPVVEPEAKPKSKYSGFSVEHYPLTGAFFPKKGGMYLKRRHTTGIYELEKPEYFMYADSARTENEAWKMIDLYIEQMHKENVRVITRD